MYASPLGTRQPEERKRLLAVSMNLLSVNETLSRTAWFREKNASFVPSINMPSSQCLREAPCGHAMNLFSFGSLGRSENQIQNQKNRADGNRGIRDIKCRPAIAADPHFKKIRHGSVKNTVRDVSRRAAKQKCKPRARHGAALAGDQQPG